jgi:excisionase family DNA binding protein
MLDIRSAAALVGRHPETLRRWVWSGRLAARREGRRLLVARDDVERLAGAGSRDLAGWAARARTLQSPAGGRSAAELVLEDRAARSGDARR